MNQQTPKKQPKYLDVRPEDLEKVLRRKQRAEGVKVSPEELFVAEFGYYYGWQAVVDLLNNRITMEDANILYKGARKVWDGQMLDLAHIVYTATAAANSGKKASKIMRDGLKNFVKQAKVDM